MDTPEASKSKERFYYINPGFRLFSFFFWLNEAAKMRCYYESVCVRALLAAKPGPDLLFFFLSLFEPLTPLGVFFPFFFFFFSMLCPPRNWGPGMKKGKKRRTRPARC